MEAQQLADTALGAARAAVAVHARHRGRVAPDAWGQKGTADFVSYVDTEAEAAAVQFIQQRCPGHAFLAEEASSGGLATVRQLALGDVANPLPVEGIGPAASARPAPPATTRPQPLPAAEWLWVIDPLDGTTNYLHGYPMYAASVGVLHHGEAVAGAVVSGVTGEAWSAWRGGGAFLDGQPIRVSVIRQLSQALIGTGFPFKALGHLPRYLRQFEAVLRASAGVRRAGSAALDLCHLATGYFDGFWELHLSPWDLAAGTLIAREAGAIVTTLDGDPDVLSSGNVLGGNPWIYEALAEVLGRVDGTGHGT